MHFRKMELERHPVPDYDLEDIDGTPDYKANLQCVRTISNLAFGLGCNAPDIGIRKLIEPHNPYDPDVPVTDFATHPFALSPSLMVEVQVVTKKLAHFLSAIAFNVHSSTGSSNIEYMATTNDLTIDAYGFLTTYINEFVALNLPRDDIPREALVPVPETNLDLEQLFNKLYEKNHLNIDGDKSELNVLAMEVYRQEAIVDGFMRCCDSLLTSVVHMAHSPFSFGLAYVYRSVIDDSTMLIPSSPSEDAIVRFIEDLIVKAVAQALGYPIETVGDTLSLENLRLNEIEEASKIVHKFKSDDEKIEKDLAEEKAEKDCETSASHEKQVQHKIDEVNKNDKINVMQKLTNKLEFENAKNKKNVKDKNKSDTVLETSNNLENIGFEQESTTATSKKEISEENEVKETNYFCDNCFQPCAKRRCVKCIKHKVRYPHVYCGKECQTAVWNTRHREFHKAIEKCAEIFSA